MVEYYQSSRLSRKKLRQAYFRILIALILSLGLILAIFYLGIPLLIKISGWLNKNQTSSETKVDITPPFAPRFEPLNEATNSASVTLKGFSEPNSEVEIFVNGESYVKLIVPDTGDFQTEIELTAGDNRIIAQATDKANNLGQPSQTLFIKYNKNKPKLEISEPADNSEVKSENRQITIQGFTSPNLSLSINGRYVIINQDGSFSYPYSLADGENLLRLVAYDEAGNETTVERKVKYSAP